ncbi:acyl-CoA dehydrogenase family protein [Mucilaginibacter sp. L196]|uniref:acyl-CoA dehydrogenase family protein n=1 Tax=Mucilaginibacter sp. L196 TaxID=1641870 RepID=UPI00131D20C2|nr:acyl-CoA dehydrogenase family protein [Mucilaginibacter sp. L196]
MESTLEKSAFENLIKGHPFDTARQLADIFAETAVQRDKEGGSALEERNLLRKSGLLNLLIPKQDGGLGADWIDILKIVRIFARVDSSIAHLFGFQHLILATIELFGNKEQRDHFFQETAAKNLFWGNALNPLDLNTQSERVNDLRIVNGRKSFCSGAYDSDMMLLSAIEDGKLIVGAVPSDREGIYIHQDWDNFGQRQTDSGTVEFQQVSVFEKELLKSPGPLGSIRASLRPCIAQMILSNIYLGLAEGAFAEAKNYTRAQTRSWLSSGVSMPQEDPYVLANYGNMFIELQAAKYLTDQAAETLQRCWEAGESITENQRGKCSLDVASAKVTTTRAGLFVCNKMFEVMGSRATTGTARLDRYWRNLRTHTLHDPVDYKIKELGNWALNQELPHPSFYS